MAQLNNVQPGDLITSAQWNALVAAVQALSGQPQIGGIPVPNLFGMTLGAAVAVLRLPSSQVNLGNVLDTLGNIVDPTSPGSLGFLVLGQSPSVGVNVALGSSLNLIVSPSVGSPPSGGQQVVVGVAQVQPAPPNTTGYDAASNTISLNHGATLGAVVFQVIAPNTDSYTCVTSIDSNAWGVSFASNQKFQGAGGLPVRVAIKVQPVPAGPASTTLRFSVSSDLNPNLSANTSPTIKVL